MLQSPTSSDSQRSTPGLSLSRFATFLRGQRSPRRLALWATLGAIGITVIAISAVPNIPKVNLSSDPLYAASGGDKPTLALALSVEFPTVGAQYVDVPRADEDASYANTKEYLGYYDAEACYSYNDAPTDTIASGLTLTDYKRFDRTGPAIALATPEVGFPYKTTRKCTNGFSGNFLNWASSSAIDMLRLSLSGGDRYIDTELVTILQRAVIPNGDPTCMWNSSNFPAKHLLKDGGTPGSYWGAVPTAMVTAAAGNDIWIANSLNRIYFGVSKAGSCNNTNNYNLTGPVASANVGPVTTSSTALPSDASTSCAGENSTCSFGGIREVWYGAGTTWKVAPANNSVLCANSVFGDPISGTVKACYTRPYSGTWTPGGVGILNTDGFFYSRVQVCNVNSTGVLQDVRDYGLCKLYPNGKYKPGGAIQKYGDQLRLAAFGYAMDQTQSYATPPGRYGGVLRAPMKYVGAKTYDEFGVDNTPGTGNPNMEWDATTGVFKANPDNDTTQTPRISGVINYLNKFGRTGPVAGRYKMYDPVGELHYETLRYLQGLQPSDAAVANLTTPMYDGFPLFTSWTDPYGGARTSAGDYSCVRSNIVVIGDINTHDGSHLPTPNEAGNIVDIGYWRGIVQKFEANSAGNYLDGQGASRPIGNPNAANGGAPSSGQGSQIMGSAYWAHSHDIRGTGWTDQPAMQRKGLRVKTFVFDVNEYAEQNVQSTRRNNNQFFMAAKYGGYESDAANQGGNPYNTKGNPFKRDDNVTTDNNVWQHLDDPGEAGAYYLQSSARGVLSAFDDIFSRASSNARSIAGAGTPNRNLTSSGSVIFQGAFDTTTWTGDVIAQPISLTAGNTIAVADKLWSAADVLDGRGSPATSRNIIVGDKGTAANKIAVPFLWGSIHTDLQTALNKATPASVVDAFGEQRLNYIRGDRTAESTTFRFRKSLLGDIINSGVVYSGKPSAGLSAAGYSGFVSSNASRTAAVFVGANDGMLHAFNALDGTELFGYIPSWVAPNLPALASKTYSANHKSFVDGPPAVGDANLGTDGSPSWKTVLVSGTGAGGKGVFALDITDPASFAAGNVLWEFTEANDPDMGYVIGRPQILKLRTNAPGGTATYKWFAVVASGVNNYADNGNGINGSGSPALFLLDLSKPTNTAWAQGSNYYKVLIPYDTTLATTKPTGVVNFKQEIGNSEEVTRIYLGDLHGKLWRLDFGLNGTSTWTMNNLTGYSTTYDATTKAPTGTPLPLFIAMDSSNNPQPITMAPLVVFGGSTTVNYVAFGTGKYLEVGDKTNTAQQSVYALYDDITPKAAAVKDTSSASSAIISSRNRLKQGAVNTISQAITVAAFKWGRRTDDDVTNNTDKFSGWFFEFPVTGEREISTSQINGSTFVFSTLFPASTSTGTCEKPGGGGNVYTINIDSGNGNYSISNVGVLGETLIFQTGFTEAKREDPNQHSSPSDSTGRRVRTFTSTSANCGSDGCKGALTPLDPVSIIAGRLSWRRINNYQDLKSSTP